MSEVKYDILSAPVRGSVECTLCEPGTYEPQSKSVKCQDCQKGTAVNITGQIKCPVSIIILYSIYGCVKNV